MWHVFLMSYLSNTYFFFKAIQHFFSGFPKSVGRPSDKNTEAMEQMMLV